jgi:hypothetical protein
MTSIETENGIFLVESFPKDRRWDDPPNPADNPNPTVQFRGCLPRVFRSCKQSISWSNKSRLSGKGKGKELLHRNIIHTLECVLAVDITTDKRNKPGLPV